MRFPKLVWRTSPSVLAHRRHFAKPGTILGLHLRNPYLGSIQHWSVGFANVCRTDRNRPFWSYSLRRPFSSLPTCVEFSTVHPFARQYLTVWPTITFQPVVQFCSSSPSSAQRPFPPARHQIHGTTPPPYDVVLRDLPGRVGARSEQAESVILATMRRHGGVTVSLLISRFGERICCRSTGMGAAWHGGWLGAPPGWSSSEFAMNLLQPWRLMLN